MIQRKAAKPRPLPSDWTVSEDITINGRHVTPGTELSVAGVRGRVAFVRHVRRDNGTEWVDAIQPGRTGWRSFRPEQVRTVHIKPKGIRS